MPKLVFQRMPIGKIRRSILRERQTAGRPGRVWKRKAINQMEVEEYGIPFPIKGSKITFIVFITFIAIFFTIPGFHDL